MVDRLSSGVIDRPRKPNGLAAALPSAPSITKRKYAAGVASAVAQNTHFCAQCENYSQPYWPRAHTSP
jgi:hypothetical protein